MQEPEVILVDINDQPIGTMGKQEAHIKGALHRAFSVLLFNREGQILLQKRASSKYHSPGLWTNTCCSHPSPNEALEAAVQRRLLEELNLKAEVQSIGSFIYQVRFPDGMIEHEYDHVFVGQYTSELPPFNLEEVDELKWVEWKSLGEHIQMNPEEYTFWFKEIVQHFSNNINQYIDENL